MIESFLASNPFHWLKSHIPYLVKFQQKFMIFFCRNENSCLQLILLEKEIPVQLRKSIRLLASKNVISRTERKVSGSYPKTVMFETNEID